MEKMTSNNMISPSGFLDSSDNEGWWDVYTFCPRCGGDIHEHATSPNMRCDPKEFRAQGFLGVTNEGERVYVAIHLKPRIELVEHKLGTESRYAWTMVILTGHTFRKNSHRRVYDREGFIASTVLALNHLAPGWTAAQVVRLATLWEKSLQWRQTDKPEALVAAGKYLAELRWFGERLNGRTGLRP
jgi:hypothetical protein